MICQHMPETRYQRFVCCYPGRSRVIDAIEQMQAVHSIQAKIAELELLVKEAIRGRVHAE
jgi:hypothetical protein